MEDWRGILTFALSATALSLIFPWIFSHTGKEKEENTYITQTKYPKRYMVCSFIGLILAIVISAVAVILLAIYDTGLTSGGWIAVIFSLLFFISFPLLIFLLGLRTYEVIQENGILVVRLVKTKFVAYSEMSHYTQSHNGNIDVYDHANKLSFIVGDNRVGMRALLDQLTAHGITKK